jgi:DNA-binding response OmpR family regulator
MPGQLRRVLVLDDDAACRELLTLVLEDAGYQVRTLADASAGLRLLRRWRADLIVLDWLMPGMDGATFLAEQRRDGIAGIPVLVVTAGRWEVSFTALGAAAAILKPFDLGELVATVARLTDRAPGRRSGANPAVPGHQISSPGSQALPGCPACQGTPAIAPPDRPG